MNTRPKLVFLITEASYLLSHRLALAQAALLEGYDVSIVTCIQDHHEQLKSLGFKVYPLHSLSRSNITPWKELKSLYEIWKIYRKIKPDIVHQVAMKPTLYGTIAARLTSVPLIINALAGLGYTFISNSLKAKILKVFILLSFRLLFKKNTIHLIVQNPEDKKFFGPFLSPHHVHLIRGAGVDIKIFKPQKIKKKNKELVMVLSARMLWDKGIGEAIETMRLLRAKRLPIQLILAGGIDLQNPAAIEENCIQQWVQEDLCQWMGHVDHMEKIYQQVDIALLPSYREGLPKALLEAAACGLPIIAADVPGCREIVVPNCNGFLVPPKTIKPLADAIEKLYINVNLRQTFGKYSRQLVEKYFTQDMVITKTLKVYKEKL